MAMPFVKSRRLVVAPLPGETPTAAQVRELFDPGGTGPARVAPYIETGHEAPAQVAAELDAIEALAWPSDVSLRPRFRRWHVIDLDASWDIADVQAKLVASGLLSRVYEQPLYVPAPGGPASPPGQSRSLRSLLGDAAMATLREFSHLASVSVVEAGWEASHGVIKRGGQAIGKAMPGPGKNYRELSSHGTSTLSVLAGQPTTKGFHRGILPKIPNVHMYAAISVDGGARVAQAITAMLRRLLPHTREEIQAMGHVLLLEVQSQFVARIGDAGDTAWTLAPVEVEPGVRFAIDAAIELGITVIEPAGNGGADLGSRGPGGEPLLGRTNPGCVLVGAARAGDNGGHVPLPASNHGSPVRVWAWGDGVPVASEHLHAPTQKWKHRASRYYSHTSAAAALVAGVAAGIQAGRLGQEPPLAALPPSELAALLERHCTPESVSGAVTPLDVAGALADAGL